MDKKLLLAYNRNSSAQKTKTAAARAGRKNKRWSHSRLFIFRCFIVVILLKVFKTLDMPRKAVIKKKIFNLIFLDFMIMVAISCKIF